jgi:hypothetical protein
MVRLLSIWLGHKEAAIYLLDHGAEVNSKDSKDPLLLPLLLTKAISLLFISSSSEELISIWLTLKEPHL